MTRDELVTAVQRAADDRPNGHRRLLHRAPAERVIGVVLDAVRAEVLPLVEREWCGVAVLKCIERLKSEGT